MSTSAYKYITAAARQKRRLLLAAAAYSAVTILCAVFHLVYTRFSYGEDSPFLQWMFLCPLLGGVLPAGLFLAVSPARRAVSRLAFNLWNSGIATLIFGCLVRAIINISGRFTDYDILYWGAGALFLLAAILAGGIQARLTGAAPSSTPQ